MSQEKIKRPAVAKAVDAKEDVLQQWLERAANDPDLVEQCKFAFAVTLLLILIGALIFI